MKRDFDEISEEEWSQHSFNASRVLKQPRPPKTTPRQQQTRKNPSPPIESFAFRRPSKAIEIEDDDEDCVVVEDSESDSDSDVKIVNGGGGGGDLVLDDDEEVVMVRRARVGRRFVIEDEEASEEEEEDEVSSSEEEGGGGRGGDGDDEDVVGKALQKCAKISADLRKELYGSSSGVTTCDRYSEVETSTVRIVTQADIDEACKAEDSDFQPILKPYQLVGVNFLLLLYKKGIEGAILADEMGLGKTIQGITYLTLLNHLHNDPGPHLVVCPASVLENWERELRKWCPSFTVLQYHGAARAAYSRELNALSKAGKPPPFNVLLVCYSLFERHSEQQKDDRKVLKRWRWSCVLMDEAHALKDKNSYRWKNLMSVARNANQRLMLTGTPLQNDLHELWSLLEFMLPDIFTTENVDLKKLLNAEDTELITRMKSILGPFILRRLKSDVMQQLVPKIQRVEYVHMERKQEDTYKEAIEEYRAASQARVLKLSSKSLNSLAKALPKRQISNYFTQFRKIANHPLLIRRIYSDEDVIRIARKLHPIGAFGFECSLERVIEEVKSYNDFRIHQLLFQYGVNDTKGTLSDKHVMLSAKCRTLAELLPSMKKSGNRVLIFSQWTSMLDILEWTLDVIGVTYRRLDGSTQVTDRQTIVDTFNNDKSIFACLLSTRAGGQGLNLTGADTVIIHDMDFNPQIDRQAEDRCHRIGQTKPVTIFRLVTKSTVDENIYEIAKRKLVLDAAVLESGVHVDDDGDTPEKTMGEILASLLMA
ncbi:unnamed protein product [Eruca vesicaria subsp. sativa]|uniref:Protein CHROMATIN REMODELING 19 n=1 Tax=Eruca vesicaria subsp. sativa TaxID=29727 RepID=A0ABC8LIM2_ERUVS|nr:unnamed protein product [Eruca vesicaria subsp. sativa]